jgi:hypothetical protein
MKDEQAVSLIHPSSFILPTIGSKTLLGWAGFRAEPGLPNLAGFASLWGIRKCLSPSKPLYRFCLASLISAPPLYVPYPAFLDSEGAGVAGSADCKEKWRKRRISFPLLSARG